VLLGEILLAGGIITAAQLEEALRAQVRYGGRLGTNLVELVGLELDVLAAGLARQHAMPPALRRHFEHADARVQHRLSSTAASRHAAIPLGFVGGDQGVIAVAVMDPLPPAVLAELEDRLGAKIVPAVAAELRIRYHLERVYGITRGNRFMRVRGASGEERAITTEPTLPAGRPRRAGRAPSHGLGHDDGFGGETRGGVTTVADVGVPIDEPEPPNRLSSSFEIDVDDILIEPGADAPTGQFRAVTAEEIEAEGRERRRFVRTLSDVDEQFDTPSKLGRIAIQRVALAPDGSRAVIPLPRIAPTESGEPASIADTVRDMRRATGRDRVGDLVVGALHDHFDQAFELALVLIVRPPIAIGWKGFIRAGDEAVLDQLAVPLDQPSLIQHACHELRPFFGPAPDPMPLDLRLWGALGDQVPAELLVAPVILRGEVACVLYGHAGAGTAARHGADAASLTEGMAAAFDRLMRAAER
jgi:hypothetical protein